MGDLILVRRGVLLVVFACATTLGCAPEVACEGVPPDEHGAPTTLSETGLFCGTPDAIAAGVVEYRPAFRRWSDGLQERRFIHLPAGGRIDASDMDHWEFPIGTRLWKELDDDEGAVETRLAERWGPTPADWHYVTYRWRAEGTDADLLFGGAPDVAGAGYDIPSVGQCDACHGRLTEHVLGFSAVQLAHPAGRAALAAVGDVFTHAPVVDPPVLAGDPASREALGSLHANCGGCHHDGVDAAPTTLELRLRVGDTTLEETSAYRTAIGVPTDSFGELPTRIVPGDAASSAVFFRLASRKTSAQMPPVGTEIIDHAGAITVGTWINELAPR